MEQLLISSLIATVYVILVLYELPLSVSAQSNGAAIPYLPATSIDNVTSSEKSVLITNSTALQVSTQQKIKLSANNKAGHSRYSSAVAAIVFVLSGYDVVSCLRFSTTNRTK